MNEWDYLARAQKLLELNRFNEALAEVLKGLEEFPESAQLLLCLALTYMELGKSKKALDAVKASLEVDPNIADSHELLARIYLERHEENQAKKAIDESLAIDPDSASGHAMAYLVYQDNSPLKAAKHLRQAREIDPEDSLFQFADAQNSVMSLKFGRLRKILKRRIAENPDDRNLKVSIGLVELSHGNYSRAEPYLQEAYVHSNEEGILDAWVDSRLAKYFPFNLMIRYHVLAYPFSLGFQIFSLLPILFFGWLLSTNEFKETHESWLWILHLVFAAYLASIYLLKYPVQFFFKLQHHPEVSIWTYRNAQKLALFIAAISYLILIFDGAEYWLSIMAFSMVYIPFWHFVAVRKHWISRSLYLLLYLLAFASFGLIMFSESLPFQFEKYMSVPALFVWIIMVIGDERMEKFESRFE